MPKKDSTAPVWARLFAAADRIKEIAPWEWMFEDEMFGVQDPKTGEVSYVSVMGHLGEHYSIAIYPGDDAVREILDLMANPDSFEPERLLEIRQLQLSYEDRNELETRDRDLIKSLGRKYRGKNAWPMFRSYQAGYIPWHLDDDEAELMAIVLEQAIDVFERYVDDDSLFFFDDGEIGDDDDDESESDRFFVRVPVVSDQGLTWQDSFHDLSLSTEVIVNIAIPKAVMQQAAKLPRKKGALEVDFFLVPAPIGERGERAQFPYMLLVVDARSGMILAPEMVEVTGTVMEALAQVPAQLTKVLLGLGYLPSEIHTKSERLAWVLSEWAQQLKIPGRNQARLPMLESAKAGMLSFLER